MQKKTDKVTEETVIGVSPPRWGDGDALVMVIYSSCQRQERQEAFITRHLCKFAEETCVLIVNNGDQSMPGFIGRISTRVVENIKL